MDQGLEIRVEALLQELAGSLPDATRALLSAALLQLVEAEVRSARERAVAICVRRGELWRTTSLRGGHLAEESRARSNEAFYLADMLETGEDLPESESSGGGPAGGGIEASGVSA